ncbi:3-ketoacyl-CoA thiolase [Streptomyces alboniger]
MTDYWPAGLPRRLDYPDVPLGAVLAGSARRYRDRAAVRDGDQVLTFTGLYEQAAAFARGLRTRGIRQGDVVALHLPNTLWFAVAYYGITLAGATVCPANPANAAAAIDEGRFKSQIVPVDVTDENGSVRTVDTDEGVRRGGTAATMAGLKPAFTEDGVVTAGNSSQISDGASALLVMSGEKARDLGLRPIARFHSFAVVGVDPVTMLTGPIPATEKVLKRAGLGIEDIGAFEINEAFASVTCAWLAETGADPDRLNPDGGAIALGHPLGASGARLTTTLLHHMRAADVRYGLQSMCEGGGMANATVLELLPR